jgi:hypothetical protein
VNLNHWESRIFERIPERDTVVSKPARVDDNGVRVRSLRLQPVDELSLMIRLERQELQAELPTVVACGLDDLIEGNRSVYFGISVPKPIQVWAVNEEHAHGTALHSAPHVNPTSDFVIFGYHARPGVIRTFMGREGVGPPGVGIRDYLRWPGV